MTQTFILIMDIIGTIAFSVSGAMIGIRRNMDIFGINMLALATAVGGGAVRDMLLGNVPPVMFQNPVYAFLSIITANTVFTIIYFNRKILSISHSTLYEKLFFWFDSLGLAAFTVDGVNAGAGAFDEKNIFLMIFMGVITGVGGGVLRDVMANQMPYIFVKHIYACASLLGAAAAVFLWDVTDHATAMLIGFAVTIIIRVLAAHYRLDLPKIKHK